MKGRLHYVEYDLDAEVDPCGLWFILDHALVMADLLDRLSAEVRMDECVAAGLVDLSGGVG